MIKKILILDHFGRGGGPGRGLPRESSKGSFFNPKRVDLESFWSHFSTKINKKSTKINKNQQKSTKINKNQQKLTKINKNQ